MHPKNDKVFTESVKKIKKSRKFYQKMTQKDKTQAKSKA
jgi:hypothetical protein